MGIFVISWNYETRADKFTYWPSEDTPYLHTNMEQES